MINTFRSRFKFSLILIVVGMSAVTLFPVFAAWLNVSEHALQENIQGEIIEHILFFTLYPVLVFSFMAIGILHYVLRSPKIKISINSLHIGSTTLKFNEITDIIVSNKVKFNHFIIPYYENVSIIRTPQQKWFIPYNYYANGHLIRTNFAQVKDFIDGKKAKLVLIEETNIEINYKVPQTEDLVVYRKSVFYFPYTYFFIFSLGLILYQRLEYSLEITTGIFWIIFLFILYTASGIRTYYFLLSERYLVVKNLFFPWQYYSFKIKDILLLESEDLLKGGIGLRLTTKDYKTRKFGCELLNRKMLEELIRKVKES